MAYREKSAPVAVFESIAEYNIAYPHAQMPYLGDAHPRLRSFTCAASGLWDDLTVSGYKYTLTFLPSGEPGPEREGVVVATRWGNPPVLLLARQVPLRWAWEVVTKSWPTTLDSAARLLNTASRDRQSPGEVEVGQA
ncbi:hypothetical protein AORI_5451 [Amycolatopsis keratiniphila]|uniref:Uncharacterized protein n=1 Tax=Amycolatopsis keratiniphila TaxID=129921 RepID=R4SXG7_9PSEU|nr:hypothetical protein AORI_5451 [Amycolatopsis keratiniphila]